MNQGAREGGAAPTPKVQQGSSSSRGTSSRDGSRRLDADTRSTRTSRQPAPPPPNSTTPITNLVPPSHPNHQHKQALEREGVETVFAYPGGASMEIHQALTRSETISNILCRHEQVRRGCEFFLWGEGGRRCRAKMQRRPQRLRRRACGGVGGWVKAPQPPRGSLPPTLTAPYALQPPSKTQKPKLKNHPQGEIFAAEGYAKVTGRVGVCIATSGPGATNLVTGLADAMMDSVPLVAITGQVPRKLIGTDGFQVGGWAGVWCGWVDGVDGWVGLGGWLDGRGQVLRPQQAGRRQQVEAAGVAPRCWTSQRHQHAAAAPAAGSSLWRASVARRPKKTPPTQQLARASPHLTRFDRSNDTRPALTSPPLPFDRSNHSNPQETPIVEVTRAITKHNYLVMDIKDLPRVIKEAFYLARWGLGLGIGWFKGGFGGRVGWGGVGWVIW